DRILAREPKTALAQLLDLEFRPQLLDVVIADRLFLLRIANDDEFPELSIAGRRRIAHRIDEEPDGIVVELLLFEASHAAARLHESVQMAIVGGEIGRCHRSPRWLQRGETKFRRRAASSDGPNRACEDRARHRRSPGRDRGTAATENF